MRTFLRKSLALFLGAVLAANFLTAPAFSVSTEGEIPAVNLAAAKASKPVFSAKCDDDGKYKQGDNIFCVPPTVTVTASAPLKSVTVLESVFTPEKQPDGSYYVYEKVEGADKQSFETDTYTYSFTVPKAATYSMTAVDTNGGETTFKLYVTHIIGRRYTEYIAPTCTEEGYAHYVQVCKQCGEIYIQSKTGITPKLDHSYNEKPEVVVADPCETKSSVDGSLDQFICTNCGEVKTEGTNGVEFDESAHSWTAYSGELDLNTEASGCGQYGLEYEMCSDCGAIRLKEKVSPPEEHVPSTGTYHPATCIEDGYEEIICKNCGKLIGRRNVGVKSSHKYVPADGSEVTCAKPYVGRVKCTVCGEEFDNITIPACSHTYVREEKAADCENAGYSVMVCSVCGYENENSRVVINPLGHTPEAEDYDCTTPLKCAVCEAIIVEAEEDHNYSDWYSTGSAHAKKCLNDNCKYVLDGGVHESYDPEASCRFSTNCAVCGTRISPIGHRFTDKVVPVSIDPDNLKKVIEDPNGEYHARYCTVCHEPAGNPSGHQTIAMHPDSIDCTRDIKCICGKLIRPGNTDHTWPKKPSNPSNGSVYHEYDCTIKQCIQIKQEPHDYSYKTNIIQGKDPTCTEDGYHYEVGECICGALSEVKQVIDPAKGHSFGDWVEVPSTCTSGGSKYRRCNTCGCEETENFNANEHTWDSDYTVDVEPSCNHEGSKSIHCSVCHESNPDSVEIITKTEHTPLPDEVVITPATCSDPGISAKECSVCGEQFGAHETKALGHQMGGWECTESASCLEPGKQKNTCTVCGYIEVQDCPEHRALGHDFSDYVNNNDAAIDKNATETATCSRCGETDTREIPGTALHEHLWGPYIYQKDATCEEDGTEVATCTKCGTESEPRTAENTKLGHSFVHYVSDGDATCTEDGHKTAVCENCHVKKDTVVDEGSALGHSFGEYTYLGDATCLADGSESAECERCKAVDIRTAQNTKLEHSFRVYEPNNDATCDKDGTETAVCVICNTEKDTRTIEGSKGHIWGSPVFEWSEDNLTATVKVTCSRDSSHTDSVQATVTHTTSKAADCFNDGLETYTAVAVINGEDITDVREIAILKLEHSYVNGVCEYCGTSQFTHVHSFDDWARSATHHWSMCACGIRIGSEKHNFVNGKCTVCGYVQKLPAVDEADEVEVVTPTEGKLNLSVEC